MKYSNIINKYIENKYTINNIYWVKLYYNIYKKIINNNIIIYRIIYKKLLLLFL